MARKNNDDDKRGLKGNPKKHRILKNLSRKMSPGDKLVKGPLDEIERVRGNKAGRHRRYLERGHVSRCH